MATQAQMDRLVGKALFDAEFRALLLADPEKAARKLRYRLTTMQASHIARLNADELDKLAAAFVNAVDLRDSIGIGFW